MRFMKKPTRDGSCDHLGQGSLYDLRYSSLGFARLSKLRHQEKDPSQTLFDTVEKLVDQVRLSTHATGTKNLK